MREPGYDIGEAEDNTDESARRISEADYSGCWQEKEFPKRTTLNLSRYYKWDQPPEALKQLAYRGDAEIIDARDWQGNIIPGTHEVKYKIDVEKLGLPTSFPVSEFQNVGFLLAYYDIYKKMEIDPGQKKQVLGVILQTAASKILDTTEELRRAKIVRTKEHYISEDRRMEIFEPWLKDNNYLYALSELRERFPELAGDTDKDVIVKTREELERAILERAKNDEVKAEMLGKLDDDVGGYSVGEDLTPHAILFYDDWVDSRFINGVIPAGFAKGTIRVAGGGADKDAPALIELYRDGKAKLKPLTSQLRTFLYIPPNMTNAYLVRVPAITPEIAQLESRGGLVLSEDSNCRSQDRLSLIFCERTDALHPTKMPERLDRSFGKDKYVLLKNGDQKLSDTPRSKLRGICIAKIA